MLLTPEEAAEILGFSPFTVRRLLRQGELPGRKVGKRQWRILRADLDKYLGVSVKPNTPSDVPGQMQHESRDQANRIEELASEQGVLPVTDLNMLYGASPPDVEGEDDSIESFLAAIREIREGSHVRDTLW